MVRPLAGEGHLGLCPQLVTETPKGPRGFHDGAGLCSPGRWAPVDRRDPIPQVQVISDRLRTIFLELDVKCIVAKMACGKLTVNPFPAELAARAQKVRAECLHTLSALESGRWPRPASLPCVT